MAELTNMYNALGKMFNLDFVGENCREIIEQKENNQLRDKQIIDNFEKIALVSQILGMIEADMGFVVETAREGGSNIPT